MKKFSKILSVALLVALVLSLGIANAFAETGTPQITIKPNDPSTVEDVAIDYVAYRILEASIDTDPQVGLDGTTTTNGNGVVAYYVTTADRAALLTATNLFNVTKVDGQDKWFVELKSSSTTADDLVAAFSAESFDLSKFESKTFDKAVGETSAASGELDAGYYYITSTLGSKIALQTLSPVTINEKNTYTTDNKTIPEVDKKSEIGQTITYTLTVDVPATANKQIVLTDTMSKGLTFKQVQSQTVKGANDAEAVAITGTVSTVSDPDNAGNTQFTITYTAEQVIAAAGKTITVLVDVEVNEDALIDTDNPNTLDLDYGNVYKAKPITVNTQPSKFTFDKVDGTDKTIKLTGAEFELHRTNTEENAESPAGAIISLVEVKAGEEYRIATPEEITTGGDKIVTKMTTTGKVITVNGIDKDLTYQLVETKAPTGYNLPQNTNTAIHADDNATIAITIENNKGTQLPSTGGIGTTIFYVVGGVLVLAAIILLVTKKRMSE